MTKYILLFVVLSLPIGVAYPCSCGGPGVSPEERVQAAEFILLGFVESITPVAENPTHGQSVEFDVLIAVHEIWKGSPGSQIIGSMVETYNDPSSHYEYFSSCSSPVRVGVYVVVLTSEARPTFQTCDHNAWMLDANMIDEMRIKVLEMLKRKPTDDT